MPGSILTPDASFEPWWWEAAPLSATPSAPPPQSLPKSVDVVIVGAGYTGLSAALTLARAGRRVLVVDAGDPGTGASTRNGGMIGSGHRVGFARLSRNLGEETAVAVLGEGLRALEFAAGLIESEGIDCNYVRCGRFRAAWRPADYEAMGREADELARLIGLETHMVAKSEQHLEVVSESYHGGCLFPAHGGLHPALFHKGLLDRARTAGASIVGGVRVAGWQLEAAGLGVHTDRGRITAHDLIVATNGYTGPGVPGFSRRVVPVASYMIATEPLPRDTVAALIPGRRMIIETRSRHCYYRPSPDGRRILFGGRAALTAIDVRNSAKTLHRLMAGLFPVLADVRVSHSWTGSVGFTTDHLPRIGGRDNVFFALGYSGSGVAMAPYLGHKVGLKVLGSRDGRTAFDDLPFSALPLYAGRPWFLPLLDYYYRCKDRLEGSP